MATTYTLISSNTLSSNAASVTFASIPTTYTDLVLKISARTTRGYYRSELYAQFYYDTNTNYSSTWILGYSSTPSGRNASSETYLLGGDTITDGNNSTANTFGSLEMYIPNYAGNTVKPVNTLGVLENNSATDGQYGIFPVASLWNQTSAITAITLLNASTYNFLTGSSFHLYGIKNS